MTEKKETRKTTPICTPRERRERRGERRKEGGLLIDRPVTLCSGGRDSGSSVSCCAGCRVALAIIKERRRWQVAQDIATDNWPPSFPSLPSISLSLHLSLSLAFPLSLSRSHTLGLKKSLKQKGGVGARKRPEEREKKRDEGKNVLRCGEGCLARIRGFTEINK